jgi:hypothetical protein
MGKVCQLSILYQPFRRKQKTRHSVAGEERNPGAFFLQTSPLGKKLVNEIRRFPSLWIRVQ